VELPKHLVPTQSVACSLNYRPNTRRTKIVAPEEEALVRWFELNTTVFSGERGRSRHLDMQLHQAAGKLFADWPTLLRELTIDYPQLLTKTTKKGAPLTRLQASVRAAVHASKQPGFAEETEYKTRLQTATARYKGRLQDKKQLKVKARTLLHEGEADTAETIPAELPFTSTSKKADAKVDMTTHGFDPSSYPIPAPDLRKLLAVMSKHGLAWSLSHNPHPCELCENMETTLELYRQVLAEKTTFEANSPKDAPLPAELRARFNDLAEKKKRADRHAEQFATQRPRMKQLEKELEVGHTIIYRDFVNHHNWKGGKVNSLILTVIWRDVAGGPLNVNKIRNFCCNKKDQSANKFFVADVMAYHLHPAGEYHPGTFDNATRLTISGDHGGHFACRQTMFDESTFYRLFGKTVECCFLCSYHAYSRCDTAGSLDSRGASELRRQGRGPLTEVEWCALVHDSGDVFSIAYPFEHINYSEEVFPPDGAFNTAAGVKKWCDVIYEWDEEKNGPGTELVKCREDGVILHRDTYGVGPYAFTDLLKRPPRCGIVPLCVDCSGVAQRAVRHHQKEGCTHKLVDTAPVRPGQKQKPQIERLNREGPQRARKKKKTGPSKIYLCKKPNCVTKTRFRKPTTANAHMRKEHPDWSADNAVLLYEEVIFNVLPPPPPPPPHSQHQHHQRHHHMDSTTCRHLSRRCWSLLPASPVPPLVRPPRSPLPLSLRRPQYVYRRRSWCVHWEVRSRYNMHTHARTRQPYALCFNTIAHLTVSAPPAPAVSKKKRKKATGGQQPKSGVVEGDVAERGSNTLARP
jgi:hypothetical protein